MDWSIDVMALGSAGPVLVPLKIGLEYRARVKLVPPDSEKLDAILESRKPRSRSTAAALLAGAVLFSSACSPEDSHSDSSSGTPSVTIASPVAGEVFESRDILVELAVGGIELAPAGTMDENTGHLHLFINRPRTSEGEIILAGEGIVHLGAGQNSHTLTGLDAGSYTIIAGLGDFEHRVIPGAGTDTVRFEVR